MNPADLPTLREAGSQLCTAQQFAEPDYERLCIEIGQSRVYHRKQWEYVYTLRILERFNLLREGAT